MRTKDFRRTTSRENTDAIYAKTADTPMRARSALAAGPELTKHTYGIWREIRIEQGFRTGN